MKVGLSVTIATVAFILLVVVIGEALILTYSHDNYSSSISDDGQLCEITSRGAHCYDVVVTAGSMDSPSAVYIYYDERYGSAHETVSVAVGARELTEESYVKQLVKTLNVRSITNVSIINAEEAAGILSGDGNGIALISLSGALPDTVYNGTSDSPVIRWIESGGRLYWAGNVLGKYIAHDNGSVTEVPNGTSLFLGSECIDSERTESYSRIDNRIGKAYSLISNDTRYSVIASKLPEGTQCLGFGFTDGLRSSSCIVSVGNGTVCIIGGDYSDYQRIDLAQIVASGLSPLTNIIDHRTGTVSGKTVTEITRGGSVYVYIGGDLTVYAELHEAV